MEICKIENCKNKCKSLGYCEKHYTRFRRHGDPNYTKNNMDHSECCIIKECTNKHHAKGYCRKHYRRFLKYGNPLYTKIESHGMEGTTEYHTWATIKTRCYCKNSSAYKYYGGRGIKVCDRWLNSFIAFYEDMGLKPFSKAQIDRKDNGGNYTPENCHWTTAAENSRNRSNNKLTMAKAIEIRLKYRKENISQRALAEIYNVSQRLIFGIIRNEIWAI